MSIFRSIRGIFSGKRDRDNKAEKPKEAKGGKVGKESPKQDSKGDSKSGKDGKQPTSPGHRGIAADGQLESKLKPDTLAPPAKQAPPPSPTLMGYEAVLKTLKVGLQVLVYGTHVGTVRYIGELDKQEKRTVIGIEFDKPGTYARACVSYQRQTLALSPCCCGSCRLCALILVRLHVLDSQWASATGSGTTRDTSRVRRTTATSSCRSSSRWVCRSCPVRCSLTNGCSVAAAASRVLCVDVWPVQGGADRDHDSENLQVSRLACVSALPSTERRVPSPAEVTRLVRSCARR